MLEWLLLSGPSLFLQENRRLRPPLNLTPNLSVQVAFSYLQPQDFLESSCLMKEGQLFSLFRLISHEALSSPSWQFPLWLWCEWVFSFLGEARESPGRPAGHGCHLCTPSPQLHSWECFPVLSAFLIGL